MSAPDAVLPEPLTPPDCDLAGLDWMPLDVLRLKGSGIAETEDAEAFRCAVLLWCAAWHQVPAASLADDDRELAKHAGLGRNLPRWREVKEEALRGFKLSSDGRRYHRVIAEKALEAWVERLQFRKRSAIGNAKRYGKTAAPEAFDASIAEAKSYLEALRSKGSRFTAPSGSREGLLKRSEVTGTGTDKKTETLRASGKETRPVGSPGSGKEKLPAPKPKAKAKAGEGSRLPVGWYAKPDERQYAVLLGFSAEEIDGIEEEFRLWWPAQPGAKGRKADWSLTWKTWCRTERKRKDEREKRAGARGRGSQSTDRIGALHRGGLAASDRRAREQPPGGRGDSGES
jgi:hypothetical protein